MLDLNELRTAFAAHLSADPLRFSMDKALAHVCQIAYQRGLKDGAAGLGVKDDSCPKCCGPLKWSMPVAIKTGPWMDIDGNELAPAVAGGASSLVMCKRCGVQLKPGIALAQTATGSPDFPGAEVVTMSPGGPGKLIDCLKCEACGWSVGT